MTNQHPYYCLKPASLILLDHLRDWTMPSNGFENGSSHWNWTGIWCSSEGFVEKLDLSNMNLTGRVSEHIQCLSKLSVLNICCNAFASSLPKSLSNLSSLTSIDVSQNNFVGNFPQGLGMASYLISINASSNNFVGFLPEDLENATSLESLDLRGSFFEGSIPKSFKNLQKLKFLGLSGNCLTGRIPRELGEMSSLETIILGYNEFQGPVPAEFGNLTNLQYLDLAVGYLSGDIPAELGRLKKLTTIYLYQNNFEGSIPPEIGNMTSAVYLDFSDNEISGEIPDEIGELKNLQIRTGKQQSERKSESEWPWRLVVFQRLNFTSADILACNKESNVIGMGSTGIVFKAEIHRPHSVVAVKKFWRSEADIETGDDLLAEVNLLGRLRHRNIVRLLGYLHNETDIMMVNEYMPNGNLGEAIHGKQAGKMLVDWVSRYNIAVGVAHGLAYLHHDCRPPVIHRDVKSNNIFLDANFEARMADFGLARTMLQKNETVSMVAGSYGYIAPEYGYTLKVDEKSDIYSFGVVLLELLTGKMPLDPSFGESIDIVEWVRRKISSKASEQALDTEIAGQCQHVQEEMLLVLRIALLCTAKLPKDRLSMRDIITMLGEAKPRRKSSDGSKRHFHGVLVSEKRDWCSITPDQKAQALKRMRGKHGAMAACDTVFKIEQ
ncbi:hypothetical protein RJ639_007687 [Escallonia herrerae]|uniref:Protein kinase domain-containing protein n=1 Tax=Escallonia herrerae TaxID=1293975 RepID=A0AA88W2J5_9ASTE|nr:hypothetical protein RJ639_007687 [Escallonia herrerae]